jgi:hypothetical protein
MNTAHHNEGAKVTPTEHSAKTASTATGLFAMLGGLLPAKGTGAPKMIKASDILRSLLHRLGVAGPAYLRALTGTSTPKLAGIFRLKLFSSELERTFYLKRPAVPVVLAGTLAILGFATAPALADYVPGEPPSFGSITGLDGVAVDQASGVVYAMGSGGVVEKFSADGTPEDFSSLASPKLEVSGAAALYQIAVDNSCHTKGLSGAACTAADPSNGDFYIADYPNGVVYRYNEAGEAEGEIAGLNEGTAVAVDASGDVLVGQYPEGNVLEYGPTGKPEHGGLPVLGGLSAPNAIALSSAGDLYVAQNAAGVGTQEFKPNGMGSFESTPIPVDPGGEAGSIGVAVDQSTNDVFVDNNTTIDEYDQTGAPVGGPFAPAGLESSNAVAVNDTTHTLYVANGGTGAVDLLVPPGPPTATGEFTSNVESTRATLNAEVDPRGAATTYHFEYLTEAQFEADGDTFAAGAEKTPESESIGADGIEHHVTAALTGLEPGRTYHYRVVATSSQSPDGIDGSDATFTTSAPPSTAETCPNAQLRSEQPHGLVLPDCRAYEMVSPLDKGGNGVEPGESRAAVSNEDPAITYLSRGSFAEPRGAQTQSRYISRRTSSGWSTQNIFPPTQPHFLALSGPSPQLLFTPELSTGLVDSETLPLASGVPAGYAALYRFQTTGSPDYELVRVGTRKQRGPYEQGGAQEPVPVGASTDLSHVVIQQNNGEGVYEWRGGKLSAIPGEVGGPVPGYGTSYEYANWWHAVSADGSRVFITIEAPMVEGEEGGQLYVRENPMSSTEDCAVAGDACTLEVSASQKTNGTGLEGTDGHGLGPNGDPWPAWYRDASANGSRVFFTSWGELTNDANTGHEDEAANLYEYNLETNKLTDLTVPATPTEKAEDPKGAAVFGLVNASEDGSYVYFVANGVLSETANSEGEKAAPGTCEYQEGEVPVEGERTCNLYLAHYTGSSWETSFIARLAGSEKQQVKAESTNISPSDEGDWYDQEYTPHFTGEQRVYDDFGPGFHSARVTADGTRLAFESERELTGYDDEQAAPGDCEGDKGGNGGEVAEFSYRYQTGKCHEVYLYDALTGKLVCASCDPSGARPIAPAELGGHQEERGSVEFSRLYLPNNLSENGNRLFFQSADPLVPHDSNGLVDVYEWEAEGEGSCRQAGGCVFPISDVAGDYESNFMDATPNGENVFFATADQLVPSDIDTRADLYDARVGGGFPVSHAPPVCDNGDSCKPPVSPQPSIFAPSGSATFSGLGNPASAPTVVTPKKKTATEIKAKALAKALKACKKDKKRSRRAACERSARKRYGATKSKQARRAGNGRRKSS